MEAFNTSHADQNLSRIDNLWKNTCGNTRLYLYIVMFGLQFSLQFLISSLNYNKKGKRQLDVKWEVEETTNLTQG